jgi:hypothetical protein
MFQSTSVNLHHTLYKTEEWRKHNKPERKKNLENSFELKKHHLLYDIIKYKNKNI